MSMPIPRGFRGLRWEPTDEQDVVLLFGRLLDHLPSPLALENVRTGFPDCKATDSETGDEILIEFELKASHFFRDHADRQEKCDWVVCWKNDLPNVPERPRIIALDRIVESAVPSLILNRSRVNGSQRDAFQLRVAGLSTRHQEIIVRLLAFGSAMDLRWPETNGASFTVRGRLAESANIEYFKVSATGRIGIAFSRWIGVPEAVKAGMAKRVNAAVGSTWFTGAGKTGRDIAELFRTDGSVDRFIQLWQEVGTGSQANRAG